MAYFLKKVTGTFYAACKGESRQNIQGGLVGGQREDIAFLLSQMYHSSFPLNSGQHCYAICMPSSLSMSVGKNFYYIYLKLHHLYSKFCSYERHHHIMGTTSSAHFHIIVTNPHHANVHQNIYIV